MRRIPTLGRNKERHVERLKVASKAAVHWECNVLEIFSKVIFPLLRNNWTNWDADADCRNWKWLRFCHFFAAASGLLDFVTFLNTSIDFIFELIIKICAQCLLHWLFSELYFFSFTMFVKCVYCCGLRCFYVFCLPGQHFIIFSLHFTSLVHCWTG